MITNLLINGYEGELKDAIETNDESPPPSGSDASLKRQREVRSFQDWKGESGRLGEESSVGNSSPGT